MKNFNIIFTNPIIYTYDDFISQKCSKDILANELIYKKSDTRKKRARNHRNSYLSLLNDHDLGVSEVCKNFKNKLHIETSKIEALQIQKYDKNCFYKPHFDVDTSKEKIKSKKLYLQRRFSILIYLNDDFDGGETFFPNLDISIKPKLCRALVFETCIRETNFPNPLSLHEGKKVTKGKKIILNTWLYDSNYHNLFQKN